jgi:hypothetical protein
MIGIKDGRIASVVKTAALNSLSGGADDRSGRGLGMCPPPMNLSHCQPV